MEQTFIQCKACGAEIDEIAAFPGRICVECYSKTEAANRPLDARTVANMWRRVI